MPRYDHWIRQQTSTHWPTDVWCVAMDERPVIGIAYVGKVKGRADTLTPGGETVPYHWWYMLSERISKGGSVTILAHHSASLWHRIGLWERCEDGQIEVSEIKTPDGDALAWALERLSSKSPSPDDPVSLGAARRLIDRASGVVCLSDGAMIVRFRPLGCRGWATWIDLGNFQAHPTDEADTAPHQAERAATWFLAWKRACRRHKLGSFGMTSASQACHGYFASFYPGGIHIDGGRSADALCELGYYGGRAEAFRIGQTRVPVRYVDFNACYTSVMSDTPVPVTMHKRYDDGVSLEELAALDLPSCLAEVTIRTTFPAWPKRAGGITVWPVGTFRTVLAGPELAYAAASGTVAACHRLHHYDCQPILGEFGRAMWQMRQDVRRNGPAAIYPAVKMLANAFVGRLAQRRTVWTTIDMPDCDISWGEFVAAGRDGQTADYRSLGGIVQRRDDLGYAPDACPAIAAWITSEARMRLWDAMLTAGREHVYYVDTDGMIVDYAGHQNLIAAGLLVEGELGRMGVRWRAVECCVVGIKHYIHDGELVHAGIPVGETERLEDGRLTYARDTTPREDIVAGRRPTGDRRRVVLRESGEYRHGNVGEDGRVSPISIGG